MEGERSASTPEENPGGNQAAERSAPPVVAVVVARDPGPDFEATLTSLVTQDYLDLSVIVVDNASEVDLTSRIATVAPDAFVKRLAKRVGYGAASNEVRGMVEGAAFFVFCHDDVHLGSDVVKLLVEEAYRSNAALVGPKLVDWDNPQQLRQVGAGSDKFAVPADLVEAGELDQEQHDAVRDVFAIPGGVTLVRADLFEALGGFDPEITMGGEDIDLGWRAHLAGGRAVVAPSAVVRHRESFSRERQDMMFRLQQRHRIRSVLTNYGGFYVVAIGIQNALLSILEMLLAIGRLRTDRVRAIGEAWVWNIARFRSILAKRRSVRAIRQVSDLEIRRLQMRGSARFNSFLAGLAGSDAVMTTDGETESPLVSPDVPDEDLSFVGRGQRFVSTARDGIDRAQFTLFLFVAVILVGGSRHLLTRGVPQIGDFVGRQTGSGESLRMWASSIRTVGFEDGASPLLPAATGLLGLLTLGSNGLVRTLLVLAPIAIGLRGMYRLVGVAGSSRAQVAAVAVYGAIALPYNSVSVGSFAGLAAYAATPGIVARLGRVLRTAPFDRSGPLLARREALSLGLVIGLTGLLHPVAPLFALGVAVAVIVGGVLAGDVAKIGRLLAVAIPASLIAVLLHLGWYIGLDSGRSWLDQIVGANTPSSTVVPISDLLRFSTGPIGHSWLAYCVLVAPLLPLAIARSWRLGWAIRGWTLALLSWGVVLLSDRGWIGGPWPPRELLLAPGAVGLAVAAGMGAIAVEIDLRAQRFGWRQIAGVGAAVLTGFGLLPLVGAALDGYWLTPRLGVDRSFDFVAEEQAEKGPFRMLWIGDAEVLPVASQPFDDTTAFGISDGVDVAWDGRWPTGRTTADDMLDAAITRARDGGTNRLGRLVGPLGIRYIVVPTRPAPAPFTSVERPASPEILEMLGRQLDLIRVEVNSAFSVYANRSWVPTITAMDDAAKSIPDRPERDTLAALATTDLSRLERSLTTMDSPSSHSGETDGATSVLLLEPADDGWRLTVDGERQVRSRAFRWASSFSVPAGGGQAVLTRQAPGERWFAMVGQLVAWLVAGAVVATTHGGKSARPTRADEVDDRATGDDATDGDTSDDKAIDDEAIDDESPTLDTEEPPAESNAERAEPDAESPADAETHGDSGAGADADDVVTTTTVAPSADVEIDALQAATDLDKGELE